jgi:hypothetical protein
MCHSNIELKLALKRVASTVGLVVFNQKKFEKSWNSEVHIVEKRKWSLPLHNILRGYSVLSHNIIHELTFLDQILEYGSKEYKESYTTSCMWETESIPFLIQRNNLTPIDMWPIHHE